MRRALAAVASVLTLLPIPPAGAQAQEARGVSRIRLASQTAWVGPGQELVLRVGITTPRSPEDVEVAVSVYRRVTSRIEFGRTLQGRPRGAVVRWTKATDGTGASGTGVR